MSQTMATDRHQRATEIHEQFATELDITVEEVDERLRVLVDDYRVPLDEASHSIRNDYLNKADLDYASLAGGSTNEEPSIAAIDEADQWIDLTAKVVELWEPRSDSVAQVGLLGDESGTIKFVTWETSDLSPVESDTVYHFGNVVTDEYEGRFSVQLNRTTSIEQRDTSIDVGDNTVTVDGVLVAIQSGSGLIKRCPREDCTRVVQNGHCSEHGAVDGEFDLRIKAVLDDGHTVQDVIFNDELTEQVTGITLEAAKEQARTALDSAVVADEIKAQLLGRYYTVAGPRLGRYVLVDEVTAQEAPTEARIDELLLTARGMDQ
jgi:replication factor A1